MNNEEVVRAYYAAWGTKDWPTMDALLADAFTFSSPQDDHLTKQEFYDRCWLVAKDAFVDVTIVTLMQQGNEFMLRCTSPFVNGVLNRTAEYLRVENGKIAEVDGYWGLQPKDWSAAPGATEGDK